MPIASSIRAGVGPSRVNCSARFMVPLSAHDATSPSKSENDSALSLDGVRVEANPATAHLPPGRSAASAPNGRAMAAAPQSAAYVRYLTHKQYTSYAGLGDATSRGEWDRSAYLWRTDIAALFVSTAIVIWLVSSTPSVFSR
jgi:hypothetical protein